MHLCAWAGPEVREVLEATGLYHPRAFAPWHTLAMQIKTMWSPSTGACLLVGALSGSVLLAACASKDQASGNQDTLTEGSTSTADSSTKTSPGTQPNTEPLPENPQDTTGTDQLTTTPGQTLPGTSSFPDTSSSSSSTSDSQDNSGSDSGGGSLLGTTPKMLPKVTGACPKFVNGQIEFNPSGIKKKRKARVWISHESKGKNGPLVFYWHGAKSSSAEARIGLGTVIREVNELGGIVVAPFADKDAGRFPWFLTGGPNKDQRMDDIILADEILACAIEQVGVDTKHIHALGMSAGALQTAQMSYLRSNYLASVVTYSGGFIKDGLNMLEPNNQMAAMIFHGGPKDTVVVNFQESSERYLKHLRKDGNFAIMCDHGEGHRIPRDAIESVGRFFQDHPFNQRPKPYDKLPQGFPGYCKLR